MSQFPIMPIPYSARTASRRLWRDVEVARLREWYGKYTTSVIAKLLHRSTAVIREKAVELGLILAENAHPEHGLRKPRKYHDPHRYEQQLKGLRKCTACRQVKPLTREFFRPRSAWCRECDNLSKLAYGYSNVNAMLSGRLAAAKTRAKVKGIPFTLTLEALLMKWKEQQGKCFYTGSAMTHTRNDEKVVSLDRLDNHGGYTPENVVLCCSVINDMKGRMSVESFLNWCRAVTATASCSAASCTEKEVPLGLTEAPGCSR